MRREQAVSSNLSKFLVPTPVNSICLILALLLAVAGCLSLGASAQTATPVNVPTWRYDNTHSGANTSETLLTPANVNTTTFGKLFSRSVDGYVYAQPLYVSGITMPDGLVHNMLFIVTQHDSVYAFDADSNGGANAFPLWQASMLDPTHGAAPGATTVPNTDLGTRDIVPEIGITSTPAIDLTTQTIYLIAKTKENGAYLQRIHALNMFTGAERANSPSAAITATVPGTGNGSSGGSLTFSSEWQMNRVALSLFNGHLYAAFGSHGDDGPWHGWLFAFDETTLANTGYICLSSNGFGNGVWGAGAGLPIDTVTPNGRLFLSTGNGSYSAYPPLTGSVNYGDSLVRFDLSNGGVTPSDAFTPFNQANLSNQDADQGSGGILMLPDQAGSHPHELIQVGKEGRILVIDRDNMGGYAPGGSSNTNIVQDIPGQIGGLWSTPAYWNGHVFFWGSGDSLKRFDLASGVLSSTPTATASVKSHFPGSSPVVSSNGTQNGIVWALRSDGYNSNGSAILYAFDPSNIANPIYESDTNPSRDDAGPAVKFVLPVVTNGKVYTGAAYQVNVYGLLNGAQQAAAPVIAPNGGSLAPAQPVTLTTTTPNAAIYYTTDGSLPTPAATLYTGPFTLAVNSTVHAIASAQNYLQSAVSTAVFTLVTQTPVPLFTPSGGTYSSAQQVTITSAIPGAAIYYTADGSTPTTNSAVYSSPVTVAATATLQAIAVGNALSPSNVVASTYSIQPGGAGINFGSGFSQVNGLTLNGSAINSDDSRLQLTNGGANQAGSFFANSAVNVTSFVNDFSFQLSNATADGFTFTIQNVAPTALGPLGGGLGYGPGAPNGGGGIAHSVAIKFDLYNNQGEGVDSTGIYQNGASPTIPAIDLTSSGIDLHSGDSMSVHMTYDGVTLAMTITDPVAGKTYTQSFPINIAQVIGSSTAYVGFTGGTGGKSASQKILSWTFASNVGPVTPTPAISPAGGSFAAPQSVTLTDATQNAVLYYTIDGSIPTTSSAVYSSPIAIGGGTVTVKTFAVAPGATASPVNAATFTITLPAAAAPSFTPTAGSYIGAQSVSIADTTPGAAIYYTTDGSIPNANSTLYSGPIAVASSETINAFAVGAGFAPSPVASAAYTIQAMGQSINYGSGFTSPSGLAFNGNALLNPTAQALQLTDGNVNEAGSVWSTTPVNVSAFTSDFNFQLVNAQADGFTFAIQSAGTTALGGQGGGLGYGPNPGGGGATGIPNSFALKFDIYGNSGEGNDSIGIYTGGAVPTIPSTDLSGSGIVLGSGDPVHVHLAYNGTVLQVTVSDTKTAATYSAVFPVDIAGALGTTQGYPGFTGGTGGMAVTTNILNWTLVSANQTVTAEPTFNPAPGTYANAVSVSLGDLTDGAQIYYTVDGSQPSHASTIYSGPIQVSGNSLTIKAFASDNGFLDSPIVTGIYTIQGAPLAQLSASSLAFGTQTVGRSSASQTVTLTNTGTAALTFSSSYLSGAATADFSKSTRCAASIPPGGTCTITLTFTPSVAGARTATLYLSDSAPGSPQKVSLSGTGTPASAGPIAQLSPALLAFGTQTVGHTSASQTVTLTNTGTAALTFSSSYLTGAATADFSKSTHCAASVAPGGTCTFSLTFKPTATGNRTATLNLSTNVSSSPLQVPLTGTGN